MDECTYEGHQYGRKYVLLVLSSLSSASSILNGNYIEGSGLCVTGLAPSKRIIPLDL
jgi:hypothetical protein